MTNKLQVEHKSTLQETECYLENNRLEAHARIGVITNPSAASGKLLPNHLRLSHLLGDPSRVVQTRHPREVTAALKKLLIEKRVNVLAINGGDGTLHSTINALWSLLDDMEGNHGAPIEAPVMLFLNGGTMNMASRAMRTKGNAVRAVKRFLEGHALGTLQDIPIQPLRVLRASRGDQALHGLIFGSEIVHNALHMHRHFGDGYMGLARLLSHVSMGSLLKTQTWKRFAHLLEPPESTCQIDEVIYARYAGVVATTVDLKLVRGLIHSMRIENTDGFQVKLLLETDKDKLTRLLPTLVGDKAHPQVVNSSHAQEIRIRGAFTLDGELYPATDGTDKEIIIQLSPRSLNAFCSKG
jgi:hypothetical protein